jgi:hypothetical protein
MAPIIRPFFKPWLTRSGSPVKGRTPKQKRPTLAMKDNKTCKTCRWWRDGKCEAVDTTLIKDDKVADNIAIIEVCVSDDWGLTARLRTGPDFGCTLHEGIKMRQEVERKIVGALVRRLLKEKFRLTVSAERGYDIDELLLGSVDYKTIMDRAFDLDDCHIFVHAADGELVDDGRLVAEGWFYLVFGNDGYDVISDYTTGVEPYMTEANAISDKYSGDANPKK